MDIQTLTVLRNLLVEHGFSMVVCLMIFRLYFWKDILKVVREYEVDSRERADALMLATKALVSIAKSLITVASEKDE